MIKVICIFAIFVLGVSLTRCSTTVPRTIHYELTLYNKSNIAYHLWVAVNGSISPDNKVLPGGFRKEKILLDEGHDQFNCVVKGGQNGITEREMSIIIYMNSGTEIDVYFDGKNLTYQFKN